MIRSASAKTARPTSRSSIWRRCAPSPTIMVFRPADAVETAECWQIALESTKTPVDAGADPPEPAGGAHRISSRRTSARKGAYELAAGDGEAEVTIFATGSEVEIALAARDAARRHGHPTRVVSVPCFELFDEQSDAYRRRRSSATRRSRSPSRPASARAGTASSAPTASSSA